MLITEIILKHFNDITCLKDDCFFSYLKGENVMRKRSMAFMMSLLIVLCTTPFVNANTGTEFDD